MPQTTTRRDAILLFVLLLLAYTYVLPRWADWSQNSRLNLVRALVEQHTTVIDAYVANTGDYALYNGRAYTDKPPGLSLVGVPIWAALLPIVDHPQIQPLLAKAAGGGAMGGTLNPTGTGVNSEKIRHFMAQVVLTATTVAIPAALLGVLLFSTLGLLGFNRPVRLLATLGYTLATPAAAYAGNYYSHQFVAALLFAALALLIHTSVRQSGSGGRLRLGWWRAALLGFVCSYVVISEYPPALIAVVIGLLVLLRVRVSDILFAMLGAIPPLVLMGWYNLAAFNTIWPVGYSHSALWQDQHHTGFMSITYPHPDALWGLTFGFFRGLFIRAPWLLLALPGFVLWWRNGQQRAFWWVNLAAVVSLLLFYSSSIMWWGGFGIGPRYLVPMLPFLALPATYALAWLWQVRAGRLLSSLLILGSALVTWAETLAGQSFPTDAVRTPWQEIVLPAWRSGDIARNLGTALGLDGTLSIVPLVLIAILLIGMLFGMPERYTSLTASSTGGLEGLPSKKLPL